MRHGRQRDGYVRHWRESAYRREIARWSRDATPDGRHVRRQGRASRGEFEFDTWRLVARDLGEGLLLVVCRPGVDSALLRMSADIAIAAWKADSRSQKRLTKRKAQRSQLLAQSQLDAPAWTSWRLLESRG